MPFDGRLLKHRLVVLAVFAEALAALMVASGINPKASEIQVAPFVDPHAQVSLEPRTVPEQFIEADERFLARAHARG